MFVYQNILNQSYRLKAESSAVESFFEASERWGRTESKTSILVLLYALLFGGLASLVTGIPVACFIGVLAVLTWSNLGETTGPSLSWVDALSLFSTSVFYFGLGYCLGVLTLAAIPMYSILIRD